MSLIFIGAQLELLFDLWRIGWGSLRRFHNSTNVSYVAGDWFGAHLSYGGESFDGVEVAKSDESLSIAVRRTWVRPISLLLSPVEIPMDSLRLKKTKDYASYYVGEVEEVGSIRRVLTGTDRRIHRIDLEVRDWAD